MSFVTLKNHMVIFTDGGTTDNGKKYSKGKYAYYINDNIYKTFDFSDDDFRMYSYATNQKCELLSIKKALEYITEDTQQDTKEDTKEDILIISDSLYSIKCLTVWYKSWEKNGWKNSKKEPVKNKEIIQEILELIKSFPFQINFKHCNSHTSPPKNIDSEEYFIWKGNNKVDELCKLNNQDNCTKKNNGVLKITL